MVLVSQTGAVDLVPEYNRQLRPVFCVSEGDAETREIVLTVTSNGNEFDIPSGAMVYVAGKKQDNTVFTYSCSHVSNRAYFTITEQMSAKDGIVLCELQIILNGDPLGSANFAYWVEPSPIQNGTTSESDLNMFELALAKFSEFDHFYADVQGMVTEAVANMQVREGQTVIDASLSVSGAAADAKATGDIVRAFMDALVTESTAEAAIATRDDAAGGLPLKRLVANIVPTQAGSGDPSPDNVRAISGYSSVTVTRTGKNVADVPTGTTNGITITKNADWTYTFTGTATRATTITIFTYTSNLELSPFKGDYVISISGLSTGDLGGFYASDLNGNRIMTSKVEGTYTTANGVGRVWLYLQSGALVSGDHVQLMVCPAEFDNTYDGYTGDTYTVTFPASAGTVYGGTLTVNSDGSGTLTLNYGGKTYDGTESWVTYSTHGYHVTNTDMMRGTWWNDEHTLCNEFTKVADNSALGIRPGVNNQEIYVVAVNGNLADVTSLATWKTWLASNPLTVTYPLANPTTYALSAVQVAQMLQGDNNIWMDAAGTLTAEYYASTGLYVEKRVNAQRNMIAGVEEAMIATKNYARNDLLIVGNTLYKVTAAISSGAALVVGTNVTETTVAEQLLALA